MLEQDEDALRAAAHAWLAATAKLDAAMRGDTEGSDLMTTADDATLARLRFHQALVDLGWKPPARSHSETAH